MILRFTDAYCDLSQTTPSSDRHMLPLGEHSSMRKLSLGMLCIGMALAIATSAHARGGSYHHPDPVFMRTDKHKTHGRAPGIRYSLEHRHYHLTYHPK